MAAVHILDANIFYSPSIGKGRSFLVEILSNLHEAEIGIFLITKGNLRSQWLQFEAGAFSGLDDNKRLCPIFLDEDIEFSDMGPLQHFQATKMYPDEIKRLLLEINSKKPNPIDESRFLDILDSKMDTLFGNWELIQNIASGSINEMQTTSEKLDLINTKLSKMGVTTWTPNIPWKPCTFAPGVKTDEMKSTNQQLMNGGYFTSERAYRIAARSEEFTYDSDAKPFKI